MAQVDFNITQGSTFDVRITVNGDDGTATDFSSSDLRGYAKAHYYSSGTLIDLNPTVVTGKETVEYPRGDGRISGLIDITLTHSQTADLPVTQGVYDIEQLVTGSDGSITEVNRILFGKFNVAPEATF